MIETKIQFNCTWSKEKVQKLLNSLTSASGITELGLSMIFMPDEPITTEEPELAEICIPEPPQVETKPPESESIEQADPNIFAEIKRIRDSDLGHRQNTSKLITTYAVTADGRVAIYYKNDTLFTTLDIVRALPERISTKMLANLYSGKRAALRGFKKHLTNLDASENETADETKHIREKLSRNDFDPYAPILTGGAAVDTRARGKVEGDLE